MALPGVAAFMFADPSTTDVYRDEWHGRFAPTVVNACAQPSLGQPGLSQAIRQPREILGAAKRHLFPEIGKTGIGSS